MADPITCHILDTTRGKPAADVVVQLYHVSGESEAATITQFAISKTDKDGRIKNWTFDQRNSVEKYGIENNNWTKLVPGIYKMKFLTGKYFLTQPTDRTFFPFVEIIFEIDSPPDNHYHIPLLLSNFSYTTYRGS